MSGCSWWGLNDDSLISVGESLIRWLVILGIWIRSVRKRAIKIVVQYRLQFWKGRYLTSRWQIYHWLYLPFTLIQGRDFEVNNKLFLTIPSNGPKFILTTMYCHEIIVKWCTGQMPDNFRRSRFPIENSGPREAVSIKKRGNLNRSRRISRR